MSGVPVGNAGIRGDEDRGGKPLTAGIGDGDRGEIGGRGRARPRPGLPYPVDIPICG